MAHEQFQALFDRGVAIGFSNIKLDTVDFRFKDEHYSVPSVSTVGIATYGGYFYTAKVEKLREIVKRIKEQEDG